MRSITIETIDLSIKHIKAKRKCSEVPPILKRAFIYIKRNNFKSFRCIQSFQTSGHTLQRVSTAKAIKNTPFRNSPRGMGEWCSTCATIPLSPPVSLVVQNNRFGVGTNRHRTVYSKLQLV